MVEVAVLDKLLTGNTIRARLVIDERQRLSVNVAHAQFMTGYFNKD